MDTARMNKNSDDGIASDASPRDEGKPASVATVAAAPATVEVSFKSLRLRPGMFLQVQPVVPIPSVQLIHPGWRVSPDAGEAPKYDAQFLGIIDDKGVMVVPQGVLALKNGMQAGQEFTVRGFTGQHDFTFASKVIRIFDYSFRDPPLSYALLSYPETVAVRQVRSAMRARVSLPAVVSASDGSHPAAVRMMDLSVTGALVNSPASLGVTGDPLTLAFAVEFDDEPMQLTVPATICRSLRSHSEDGFLTGLLFKDISRNDKLLLHYFVLSSIE